MNTTTKLSTQQIGKLGELLVQYRFLSFGIESASLTTDSGIDLVAYANSRNTAFTIQVKTNLKPKPGGGKGKAALDWWVPENSPAELFALVDVSTNTVWIFTRSQIAAHAQQRSSGRFHLYMYSCSIPSPCRCVVTVDRTWTPAKVGAGLGSRWKFRG